MDPIEKYAELLVDYCLELHKGEKFIITSTYLAEPLVQHVYRKALERGAHPYLLIDIQETDRIFLDNAVEHQLQEVNPFFKHAMETFDAYLNIRAPFNNKELQHVDPEKQNISQKAKRPITQTYFRRIGNGEMKRSLCQFPTQAAAQEADMSLGEYTEFVFNACHLYAEDPKSEWLKVRAFQQNIVDHLNRSKDIRYKGKDFDISFNTNGRTWINSDGRNNMPSGEVFTSPVEDSVNGVVRFSYPGIYMGHEVDDITLTVKDGRVEQWEARRGKKFLDQIFKIDGARFFGEVAIGTNYGIQTFTKNILFDEKIGGTIHMAIGQSYHQAGGKNESSIHWDMIADMKNGGEIYTDGEVIYRDGKFLL